MKNKEPIINQEDRARIVGALKCVDEVFIVDTKTTVDKVWAHKNRPFDVLFAGDDWKGSERFEQTVRDFEENGLDVEIVFFPYTQSVSTSKLREKLKQG